MDEHHQADDADQSRPDFAQGMTPEDAFKNSCESITGPITKTISKQGIYKVREHAVGRGACGVFASRIGRFGTWSEREREGSRSEWTDGARCTR